MKDWKRVALFPLVGLLAASCDPRSETSYVVVEALKDDATGRYVELGQMINFSSFCYVVNVFDAPAAERRAAEMQDASLMVACSVGEEEPRIVFEAGCYVLSLDYGYGGILNDRWTDPETGRTLCLKMIPPGPKGGWKP